MPVFVRVISVRGKLVGAASAALCCGATDFKVPARGHDEGRGTE
jgi:hypothetical protein